MRLTDLVNKCSKGIQKATAGVALAGLAYFAQPALAQETEKKFDKDESTETPVKEDEFSQLFNRFSYKGKLRHTQFNFENPTSTTELLNYFVTRPDRLNRVNFGLDLIGAHAETEQGRRQDTLAARTNMVYGRYFDFGDGVYGYLDLGPNASLEHNQGLADFNMYRFGGQGRIGFAKKNTFMTDLKFRTNFGVYEGDVASFPVKGTAWQFDAKWDGRVNLINELALQGGFEFFTEESKGDIMYRRNQTSAGIGLAISPTEKWLITAPEFYVHNRMTDAGRKDHELIWGVQGGVRYFVNRNVNFGIKTAYDSKDKFQVSADLTWTLP